MAISQHWTVIGIFDEQDSAKKAMEELLAAGFTKEQVGFVMRDTRQRVTREAVEEGEESGSFTGGVLGGILGAADALLIPVLGPDVASSIPVTVEPWAEQIVARFQRTGVEEQQEQDHVLPVTDDDIPENSPANETAETSVTTATDTVETPATTNTPTHAPATEDVMLAPGELRAEQNTPPDIARTREDEATGAVTGGIVGGVIGVAAGLLLPFIGPAIAGGALIAALGGAALGAVAGGFMGAFVSMGVPEEQARQYAQEVKSGRTIVTVKTDDRQQDALDIFHRDGAMYANAHEQI